MMWRKATTMAKNKKKGFLRDRRGSIAVIIALSVPVTLGLAALSVDIGYIASMQAQLRATAEATALAAATALDDAAQAQDLAVEFAEKNMPPGENGTVLQNADIVLGNWEPVARTFTPGGNPVNAVQVTARRTAQNGNPVALFFAPTIGIDTADVSASATATDALRIVN